MSLCNPELVDRLNRYFIPLVLEIDHSPHVRATSKTDPGRAFLARINDIYARGNSLLRTLIVSDEGRILDIVEPMARPIAIAVEVDQAIARLGLRAGPVLTTYESSARRPDAALQMRVVLRYTDPDFVTRLFEKLHPYCGDFRPDITSLGPPTRDWITLSLDECRRLLPPPNLSEGQSYLLDDDLTRRLLVQFRPEPALMMARSDERARSRVRRVRLCGTVCAVEGQEARVCLEGELEMIHPGLRPDKTPPARSDQNTVRLSVAGWLECDRVARRVARFSLATRSATYAAASGGEVHYEGVAYTTHIK